MHIVRNWFLLVWGWSSRYPVQSLWKRCNLLRRCKNSTETRILARRSIYKQLHSLHIWPRLYWREH